MDPHHLADVFRPDHRPRRNGERLLSDRRTAAALLDSPGPAPPPRPETRQPAIGSGGGRASRRTTPVALLDPRRGEAAPTRNLPASSAASASSCASRRRTPLQPDGVAGRTVERAWSPSCAARASRRGHDEGAAAAARVALMRRSRPFFERKVEPDAKPPFSRSRRDRSSVLSTILFAIASPSPVPPLRAEKSGSKRRSQVFASTPGRVSSTAHERAGVGRRAVIRILSLRAGQRLHRVDDQVREDPSQQARVRLRLQAGLDVERPGDSAHPA